VNSPDGLDHSYDALRDVVTADPVDLQNNPDLQDYVNQHPLAIRAAGRCLQIGWWRGAPTLL
jgi:hypothetical protein